MNIPAGVYSNRYAILFYSLMLTIAASPLLGALGFSSDVLEILLATNLLISIVPVTSRYGRLLLFTVLTIALVARLGAAWFDYPVMVKTSLIVWTCIALVAAVGALRFCLGASLVSSEHLYAALSAYVLVGIFCGVSYMVLELAWPGSIVSAGDTSPGNLSLTSGIYFSFVTLATLGYGDVVPKSELARGLAIIEAVAGQLYLAVMVARLVSLYSTGRTGKTNSKDISTIKKER